MNDERKAKVDGMTPEEQEKRLAELNDKSGIMNPHNTRTGGVQPDDLEDLEEREYLKAKLGYSNP